jgi:NAD(P)-dependent dehydrogenase (short-subunit alcohol dehydrogenase family)
MRGLKGRVIIVTGGASGIGLATVTRLAAEGSLVVAVDRDDNRLSAAVAALGCENVLACCGDASQPADIDAYFQAALGRFGRVDALFNHAGIRGPSEELVRATPEEARDVFTVNVGSVLYGMQRMFRQLEEQGGSGIILNTSSGLASRGAPRRGLYAATKAAIISLTRTAALEGAARGVRVNAIVPGPTATPQFMTAPPELRAQWAEMIPLARFGKPSEIADAATWLLSDESSFVTGAAVVADGGEGC